MEQLILIKSIMKPRDYSTLRAILKERQGEKITPNIFKMFDVRPVKEYLEKENISYEIYNKNDQSEIDNKEKELEKAYKLAAKDKERWNIGKKVEMAAASDFVVRERKRK